LRTKTLAAALGLAALTVLIQPTAAAQRARVSPRESVSGVVDGAHVTISYGRPSMRGRKIFGALVPYGTVWCPGADEATTLESDKPLRFGALAVPPGPHTIWMLPTADVRTPDGWTLIVSEEPSGFHKRYNASADLGRVPLKKSVLDGVIEQLTFVIQQNKGTAGGTLSMVWETTQVEAPFTVVQ
jgi:hypothetical protein